MKPAICLVLVLVAAVLECQSYGVSSRRGSQGYSRPYGYRSYYRRRTCQVSGCSPGYTCRRREFVERSSRLGCLPDPRAAIRSQLNRMERFWNRDDFNGFATLFTQDVTLLPPNLRIGRGVEGFAEFLAGWKPDNGWGDLRMTVDKVESPTENFHSAVAFFELQSVVNAPVAKGKILFLWKSRGPMFLVDTVCFNFDPPA